MDFLRLLESIRTPFFDTFFQFFTMFGEETLFMVISLVFLWCYDKKCGYYLLYTGITGALANGFLKQIFCIPRPWVLDPNFTIVESARAGATGYSFPSGHTQTAVGLYLGIARRYRVKWVRIACIVLVALVGFSRMYLGVHTPADVLVSLGVGVLLAFGSYVLFQRAWNQNWKWFYPLLAFLVMLCAALVILMECVPRPMEAIAEFSDACVSSSYKMIGAGIGFCIVLWLDTRFIHYETKAVWWAQILKCVGGLLLILGVRALKEPLLALTGGHDLGNAIRYFLMILAGGALWPLTFRWFGKLCSPSDAETTSSQKE